MNYAKKTKSNLSHEEIIYFTDAQLEILKWAIEGLDVYRTVDEEECREMWGVSSEKMEELVNELKKKVYRKRLTVKDIKELPLLVQEDLRYRVTEQLRDMIHDEYGEGVELMRELRIIGFLRKKLNW